MRTIAVQLSITVNLMIIKSSRKENPWEQIIM